MFRKEPRVVIIHEKPVSSDFEEPREILLLNGKLPSSLSNNVKLSISEVSGDDPVLISAPEYDPKRMRAIAFSVMLTPPNVTVYQNRSQQILERGTSEASPEDYGSRKVRCGYSVRSLLFNRALHDDLFLVSKVALIGNLLSRGARLLPRYEVSDFSTSQRPLYMRFNLQPPPARSVTRMGLKRLDFYETFQFIMRASEVRRGGRICSFSRGLNYLVRGLARRHDDTSQIIWCVSALECFLTKPSETGSQALIQARLSAVCRGEKEDAALGVFRQIYKFRNEFLHGNQDIPIYIGGASLFPDSIERPSQVLGEPELAANATALALKVAQRMIELKSFDLSFETTISKQM